MKDFSLQSYLRNNKLLNENFDYENDEYRKNPEYYDKLHQDMKKEKEAMAKKKAAGEEVMVTII